MDLSFLIPIMIGWLAGWLTNYLADVFPESLRLSRPFCLQENCKAEFKWMDYLFLRKCRACGKRRRLRSILVHVLCVGMAAYLWLLPASLLGFWGGYPVFVYLLIVALIDLEHRLVLRPLSIVGMIVAFAAGFFLNGLQSTLIGGAAGFGIMFIFYLFGILFTRLRARRMGINYQDSEEALGSGDVTLATILGLLLGWPLILFTLILGILLSGAASLIIIIVVAIRKRYRQQALMIFIPLGPFFIFSAVLLLFFPNWITAIM